jgi:hypothetical protein
LRYSSNVENFKNAIHMFFEKVTVFTKIWKKVPKSVLMPKNVFKTKAEKLLQ